MENINVQVYSLVSEPISPIEKLKTIAKLGFAGAEFTADFTEVPVEEMKKVLAENNLKVDSAHVGLDQIEGVLPYFAELGAKLVICPATNFCDKAEAEEVAAVPSYPVVRNSGTQPPRQHCEAVRHQDRLPQPHRRVLCGRGQVSL